MLPSIRSPNHRWTTRLPGIVVFFAGGLGAIGCWGQLNENATPTPSARLTRILDTGDSSNPVRLAAFSLQEPSKITEDRLQAIRDQIKLIKQLNDEKNTKAENKANDSGSPVKNAAKPHSNPTADPANQPLPDSVTQPKKAQPAIVEPTPSIIPIPDETGTPVVTKPVNTTELANSLFLTGNIAAARQQYQSLLKEKITQDEEQWLKCLIGCCYRLEGEYGKSESIFREVTSNPNNTYPINYSKWCLQYLDQRRNTRIRFREVELEINDILEMVKKNE